MRGGRAKVAEVNNILGHLFIPGRMPGVNDLMDARMRQGRTGWNAYSALKRNWSADIVKLARVQMFPVLGESYFTYLFDEVNKKRDPSNVIGGGVKFIEDGLKRAGQVPHDGWRHVLGIRCFWRVNIARPGVHVFATSDDCMTFEEVVYEADTPRVVKSTIAKQYKQEVG